MKLGTPAVAGAVPYTPAGSSAAYLYSADRRPNLSAVVSDPDADNVTAEFQVSTSTTFGTVAASCITGAVASGATAACEVGTDLAADGRYYVRGRSKDSNAVYGSYSDPLELRIAAVTPLATYTYDSGGRLVQATDARTNLTTVYAWTGTGTTLRLSGLTPAGQAGYAFAYTSNKLAKVTRANPASAGGGTAQLAAFVYGVPATGTGLPDLPAAAGAWAQVKAPTTGFAVFGPDQPITGITPAAVTNTDWWKRADLTYTDGEGWTVNTAGWGAATQYDQGAPNGGSNPATGQPYRLPTTQTVTSEFPDGTINSTPSRTITGYQALEAGDVSGWELGQATSATVDMDLSGGVNAGASRTRYDARGRTIENRQPTSDGSDAGTRQTVYYTGDTTASAAACRTKPEYAGLVCRVGPKAQPAGQSMPVTTSTAYTWDLETATEQDVSGPVTSTTTTSFNAQDRPVTTSTSVSGLSSSAAVPAVTTSYDAATGNVTGTTSTAGSTAMTYDTWGRELSYTTTPAGQPADTATTTYNNLGQITSVVDGNGQTAYTYDGTDANGQPEYRGLVTAVTVKVTGGVEYTSTGAYDHAGALTTEKLPGKIIRRTSYDTTGRDIGLAYTGQLTDRDTGAPVQDQPWLGWTTIYTAADQIQRECGVCPSLRIVTLDGRFAPRKGRSLWESTEHSLRSTAKRR